jgi:hypothetical protein
MAVDRNKIPRETHCIGARCLFRKRYENKPVVKILRLDRTT